VGKLKNNQKGFTAVEVLLIVLILVVIGAVGYMAYRNDHKTKTVSTTNTSTNKPATSTTKTSTSTPSTSSQSSTSSTTTVFKIPELGIEVTVPNSIKDIVYKVNATGTVSTGQQTQSVTLSTQTLTNLDPDCSVNGSAPPLGTISKTQGQYPSSPDADNASGGLVKQFSTYYIAWRNPQAPCGSAPSTQTEANTDTNLFSAALHSTVAPIQ
jgi:Tfp pilus assembly protein PilV